jgi:hypothetical protein
MKNENCKLQQGGRLSLHLHSTFCLLPSAICLLPSALVPLIATTGRGFMSNLKS